MTCDYGPGGACRAVGEFRDGLLWKCPGQRHAADQLIPALPARRRH